MIVCGAHVVYTLNIPAEWSCVCGAVLGAVQGYFLLSVNILDRGVRRWLGTIEWNLNRVFSAQARPLKDTPWVPCVQTY